MSEQAPLKSAQWQVRWATPDDTDALLALFERSFGAPMGREEWLWKYRFADSPGVVCVDDGELVAFNGGMPRPVTLEGRDTTAVQMGDVMVDPRYRGILTRKGPFYRVVQAFFAEKVGEGLDYRYAFGFPHARHARLGSALKLYCETDRIEEARWSPRARRGWRHTARPLTADDAPVADALWQAMRQALPDAALCQRDSQWLAHRYRQVPGREYLTWLVVERLTRRPVGICVLRQHGPKVELLDLVAPPSALNAVLGCARHLTARLGCEALTAWVSPRVARALAPTRPELSATEVVVPGSQVNGKPLGMELEKRWWLMGGDTDFR
ncbi:MULTISPECIES: GNAT family N-acetyltransferase [unclassified Halomonas]|uniref:GNAT family N-acetyltransferase n=1 Tax=unclassified Halomonas TaxID=2609666 RepID=UPI00209C94DE|nr:MULTISPECIES: GNAT family N-acetyltransferase [unclassified Halomonas]MCP1314107.1 GNAT family N-acetyltransferase [Halomonas sp. 707D7]MCP1325142.1 GNAT family N-acetyltransferase [Halomonas sp. 707D4]